MSKKQVRHQYPILVLDQLAPATYYYWLRRIGLLYQLCIWAACYKARGEGVSTTLEGIFGDCGFAGSIYRDTRTDAMIVAFESPGDSYEYFGEMYNSRKSTYDIQSGKHLISGVQLTAVAIHQVLRAKMGSDELKELLEYLPFFGKFKGESLPYDERLGAEMKRLAAERVVGQSDRSLRDSHLPRHKVFLDDHDMLLLEMQQLFYAKVVKKAIRVLEGKPAIVPKKNRPQQELIDLPEAG